jgi:lipopolysaccharide export LptBFGC system permease protein LptF
MSPIVYGVFVVFGLIFVIISITSKRRAAAAQAWPTIPGTVLASRVDIHTSTDSDGHRTTTYKPVVDYQYTIMGQEFRASRIAFGANTFSRNKSESIIAMYPPNQPLTVHYNPDKPQDAVLEAEAKGGVASLIIGIVLMGVGVVMAVVSFLG